MPCWQLMLCPADVIFCLQIFSQMSSRQKSPNNENEHLSLARKIEAEQQRLAFNEQRIATLEQQRLALSRLAQEKEERLAQLKEDIKRSKGLDNPVVRQLREHFRALREQLGEMIYEDENDDVDIDNMTYEELLELEEKIGSVSKGLPTHKFEKLDRFDYEDDLGIQEDCSICRDQFESQQPCVRLPCKHYFHHECVRMWCTQQKVCPNCKTEIQ